MLRFAFFACIVSAVAQPVSFIKYRDPVIVLNHVRIVDGTGAAPMDDMRIVIQQGKIGSVRSAKDPADWPSGANVLDLTGKTAIPGLIGMHEHLFYPMAKTVGVALYGEMADSAPRLYLAAGVTTARTAGSVEPATDLAIKKLIDAGAIPGPRLDVTGPYLGGLAPFVPQLKTLSGPAEAERLVDYWSAQGVTSFKAYMDIKPEELKAAVDRAHAKGIKVTGHLCSVGFREAAALGIDNLEHGLIVDTEFLPGKKPGVCPNTAQAQAVVAAIDINGAEVRETIRDLVTHHVAVTSTLAIFETLVPNRPPLDIAARQREFMTDAAWGEFLTGRARLAGSSASLGAALLKKEMEFERAFVQAGGLLTAGADPTAYGGAIAGFADLRNIDLLMEAGFSFPETIHIMTQNGATYLGIAADRGSIAPGKAADLVILQGTSNQGTPSVETVFKDGAGYDPQKLRDSVRGLMGLR
jgi:imidazolonepropionase-like amidohydrolase